MVILLHKTNAAVAFVDGDLLLSLNFEPDCTTVAAAFYSNHLFENLIDKMSYQNE